MDKQKPLTSFIISGDYEKKKGKKTLKYCETKINLGGGGGGENLGELGRGNCGVVGLFFGGGGVGGEDQRKLR